jgi:nucleoside-triphosphatase
MTWRERAETRLGVSGAPGVGKTTLVLKVVEVAKAKFTICGFVTVEVRQGGSRIGFDVVDINTGRRVPLARVGVGQPSVGKYVVNLDACDFLTNILSGAGCDLLVIDEIGAMEFKCLNFGEVLHSAVQNSPRVLATVHRNYIEVARRLGFEVFWLTRDNWEMLYAELLRRLEISQ